MSTIQVVNGGFDMPALMTVEQVGKLLSVSTRTVWRLRSAGAIPRPVKIAGGVRWRANDLKSWIDDGCPAERER